MPPLTPRHLESELRDVLAVSRAGAILGPRQAGKSTLALQLRDAGIVPFVYSLDEEALRDAARADPDGFIASLEMPATIDEIQRAPGLMLAIKRVLDASDVRGRFLLTGSADLVRAGTVADALPGRVEYLTLWPLSQGELEGHRETFIDALLAGEPPRINDAPLGRGGYAERIVRGGFPDIRGRDDRQRARAFASYVQTIVGRDLPELDRIRIDRAKAEQLVRLLAARSSNLVNFTSLARDLELDDKTVKAHIGLLEDLFLVRRLRPWLRNLGARQIKTPKVLLCDSGLIASLIGADAARFSAPDQSELAGPLLESFVVMELVKQTGWSSARVELFFYRDAAQREVDVVIESVSGSVAGIEIKSAASVGPHDTRGLRHLRDTLGDRFTVGIVLYTGSTSLRLDDRIWAVPLAGLWS